MLFVGFDLSSYSHKMPYYWVPILKVFLKGICICVPFNFLSLYRECISYYALFLIGLFGVFFYDSKYLSFCLPSLSLGS